MQDMLNHVLSGQSLTVEQTVDVFEQIMSGEAPPMQVAALLAMMQLRKPTVPEIVGAAKVMRDKAAKVTVPDGITVIDTCGTGGDHGGTFNISTAAALVAAGAGCGKNVAVAKHGNRSVTSKSGSSQVLETLGVKLQVEGETLTKCLAEAGICFCFAPAHHPAMKHVMPIRVEMGIRTVFNILGPLTNPAGAKRQVMGVYDPALTETLCEVLRDLGSEQVMIVHGVAADGRALDELLSGGTSTVSHLQNGEIKTYEIGPNVLGDGTGELADIQVSSPEESAKVIQGVLAGEQGPAREVVCLNAAAAMVVADLALDLHDGMMMASKAIDSGAAKASLDKLVEITNAG